MKPNRSSFNVTVLFLVIAFAATACVPRSAPVYKGGLAQEPTKMTPYVDEKNGINMALPPGWKSVPVPEGAIKLQKAQFQKHGSDAILRLFCEGAFATKDTMRFFAISVVNALDPKALEMWKTNSFGGTMTDPEFESWAGTDSDSNYYLGWKFTRGFGCKYVLVLMVPKDDADFVEGDFLAIMRALKH